jgi:hypothetical protein
MLQSTTIIIVSLLSSAHGSQLVGGGKLMRKDPFLVKGGSVLESKAASRPSRSTDHIKDGYCSHFEEGSSVRDLGEQNSYWGPHNAITAEQCWSKCEIDKACEQAIFLDNMTNTKCWIGINAMTEKPVEQPDCEAADGCHYKCYARNGFGHTLDYDDSNHVQDGFCAEFAEGGGHGPLQCDLLSTDLGHEHKCSHWGAEFGISERGCWVKCQENAACTQAVYEDHSDGHPQCFLGTNLMTDTPGMSRCAECNNRCYAKIGFGTVAGGEAAAAHKAAHKAAATAAVASSDDSTSASTDDSSDDSTAAPLADDTTPAPAVTDTDETTAAPATDATATDAVTDAPATDAPGTDVPATDVPAVTEGESESESESQSGNQSQSGSQSGSQSQSD